MLSRFFQAEKTEIIKSPTFVFSLLIIVHFSKTENLL